MSVVVVDGSGCLVWLPQFLLCTAALYIIVTAGADDLWVLGGKPPQSAVGEVSVLVVFFLMKYLKIRRRKFSERIWCFPLTLNSGNKMGHLRKLLCLGPTADNPGLTPCSILWKMSCLCVVSYAMWTLNETLTKTFHLSPELNLTGLSRIVTQCKWIAWNSPTLFIWLVWFQCNIL